MGVVMLENGMVEFVDYDPAQVYQDMYAAGICYGRWVFEDWGRQNGQKMTL